MQKTQEATAHHTAAMKRSSNPAEKHFRLSNFDTAPDYQATTCSPFQLRNGNYIQPDTFSCNASKHSSSVRSFITTGNIQEHRKFHNHQTTCSPQQPPWSLYTGLVYGDHIVSTSSTGSCMSHRCGCQPYLQQAGTQTYVLITL